jgi:hypothetical protein
MCRILWGIEWYIIYKKSRKFCSLELKKLTFLPVMTIKLFENNLHSLQVICYSILWKIATNYVKFLKMKKDKWPSNQRPVSSSSFVRARVYPTLLAITNRTCTAAVEKSLFMYIMNVMLLWQYSTTTMTSWMNCIPNLSFCQYSPC